MKAWLGWLVVWSWVWLGACGSSPRSEGLQIGVVAPLTGSGAAQGAEIQRAVELFEEAHPDVRIVLRDAAAEPAASEAAARAMIEAGVDAVVGHPGGAAAAAPIYQAAGVPFVASGVSDRAIPAAGDHIYPTSFTSDVEGQRIVAYLRAVIGAERFVLIHADDAESIAVARSVGQQARTIGLGIERTAIWSGSAGITEGYLLEVFPEIAKQPRSRAGRIGERLRWFGPRRRTGLAQRLDIDAIVVIGGAADGVSLIEQLREAALDVPVIGSEQWCTPELAAGLGRDVRDVYLTAGHTPEIETQQARAWRAEFGTDPEPGAAALHTYEALQIFAAASASGASDAEKVASFLEGMWDPDSAVEGMSDLLYFDPDGVMQREPWFLTPHRGKLKPAFTQLRTVINPRDRWRAGREDPEATPGAGPEAEAEAEAEPVPEPEPEPEPVPGAGGEDDRGAKRRNRRPKSAPAPVVERSRTARKTAGPAPVERRIAIVGDQTYHLTSVVYAGIDFYRINDVNVAGQDFDVELFLWFQWQGDADVENIAFLNQIFTEDATWEVLRQDLDGDVKYTCYKIKGTFLTPYDLRSFPFDQQRLPLSLAHKTSDSRELVLVVDHEGLSHEVIEEIYPEEWTYVGRRDFSAMYEPSTTFGDPAYLGPASQSSFSVYQAEIVLKRILFPYLVTLFLPLGIMVMISLFVVLVPPHQFDARMTLVMTALLSILVFHLAQGESLPSVGYLMRADQYFMVTYVLMFLLIVKTVLVNATLDQVPEERMKRFERWFAVGFVATTLVVYLILTLMAPS